MIGLADRDRRSKQLQLESGIQDLLDTYIEAYNVWRELCAECPRSVDICARHVPFDGKISWVNRWLGDTRAWGQEIGQRHPRPTASWSGRPSFTPA